MGPKDGETVPKLTPWQLVAYGQLVMPLAVIGLPVAVYIPPFYSSTLGLDLAAVGLILMLARITDVITDPLIGRLSDRTHALGPSPPMGGGRCAADGRLRADALRAAR